MQAQGGAIDALGIDGNVHGHGAAEAEEGARGRVAGVFQADFVAIAHDAARQQVERMADARGDDDVLRVAADAAVLGQVIGHLLAQRQGAGRIGAAQLLRRGGGQRPRCAFGPGGDGKQAGIGAPRDEGQTVAHARIGHGCRLRRWSGRDGVARFRHQEAFRHHGAHMRAGTGHARHIRFRVQAVEHGFDRAARQFPPLRQGAAGRQTAAGRQQLRQDGRAQRFIGAVLLADACLVEPAGGAGQVQGVR
ncbi:hypothetical protein D3C81_382570 [compost metagenome]